MAIEIVGEDPSRKLKATCRNCGAILEFLPIDVKHETVYSFGESSVISSVKCPRCKCSVPVKESCSYP